MACSSLKMPCTLKPVEPIHGSAHPDLTTIGFCTTEAVGVETARLRWAP